MSYSRALFDRLLWCCCTGLAGVADVLFCGVSDELGAAVLVGKEVVVAVLSATHCR